AHSYLPPLQAIGRRPIGRSHDRANPAGRSYSDDLSTRAPGVSTILRRATQAPEQQLGRPLTRLKPSSTILRLLRGRRLLPVPLLAGVVPCSLQPFVPLALACRRELN